MPKFVTLLNVAKSNQPVYVNADNILWFERAEHGRVSTIVRFAGADRQLVIDGPPEGVLAAMVEAERALTVGVAPTTDPSKTMPLTTSASVT